MATAKKEAPKPPKAAPAAPAQAPVPAPAQAAAPAGQKTNAMAIVALIFAFFLPLVGLILGIVALSQIKKKHEGGHGLAVASVILSIVFLVLQILAVALFWGALFAVQNEAKKQGVDINNGSINVKNEEGDSVSIGNAKVPDGFPSDVPVYTPSKITGSSKYGGNKYTVVLTTADSASKVQDYYKTQLAAKGWSSGEGTGSINFESGTVATFTKGSEQLLVTITSQNKGGDNNTLVSLTVGPKETE